MALVLRTRTNDGADGIFARLVSRIGLRAKRITVPMTVQPLTSMVAALEGLLGQERAADQREVQAPAKPFQTSSERERNLQAIDHLERAMAYVAAENARDAVVQVLIAAGHAQTLEQEMCDQPLAEELSTISRLLRSALPALARDADLDLETFGASHYGLGGQSDPRPEEPDPKQAIRDGVDDDG